MKTINAEARAQNPCTPSSSGYAHPHPAVASRSKVTEVQSIYTVRPWNPAGSRISYVAKPISSSCASGELEIEFYNTHVKHAITQVHTRQSSVHVTAAACEPDRISAALNNAEPDYIDLTTTSDTPTLPTLPTLHRKNNQHIIALLEETHYLAPRLVSDDNTILTSELVVAAIRFVNQKQPEDVERNMMLLVRSILRDRGYYGGHADETMTLDDIKDKLRGWISITLFDAPLKNLIVEHLEASKNRDTITTQELANGLRTRTLMLLLQGLVDQHTNLPLLEIVEDWIWQNIHCYVAPLLMYDAHNSDLELTPTDPRWGLLHAGFLFASQYGFDIHTISKELALEAGKLLVHSLGEKDCIFNVEKYFDLPVRFHQFQTNQRRERQHPLDKAGELLTYKHALNCRLVAATQVAEKHTLIAQLQEALRKYQTAPQIAKKNSREPRTSMDMGILSDTTEGLHLNTEQLNHDSNRLFFGQIYSIRNLFSLLDLLMIDEAFDQLEKQELAFISHASLLLTQIDKSTITRGMAPSLSLPPLLPLLRKLLNGNPVKIENFFLDLMEGMDIFVASTEKEQRVYAFETHNTGYNIRRIVLHDGSRLEENSTIKLTSNSQTLYEAELGDLNLSLDTNKSNFHKLLMAIRYKHQSRFYQHLYTCGRTTCQPDTAQYAIASFEVLRNCLDINVSSYLLRSHHIGEAPISNPQLHILAKKQHNSKDIDVPTNPGNGMPSDDQATLSKHQFLESLPLKLTQPMPPANPKRQMKTVESRSMLTEGHEGTRSKRKALTRRAPSDNTEMIHRPMIATVPPQADANHIRQPPPTGAVTQAQIESDHYFKRRALYRWGCIIIGNRYQSQQPGTTAIDQTAKNPSQQPQQPSSTGTINASHWTYPTSTMGADPYGPAAASSELRRRLELSDSAPRIRSNAMSRSSYQTGHTPQRPDPSRNSPSNRFPVAKLPTEKRTQNQ